MGFCDIEEVDDVSILFDRAHLAIAAIKDEFKQHLAFYDSSMREKLKYSQVISAQLGTAIRENQIVPYLQYSVVFIYLVLFQYYFTAETVESICMVLKITAPQIYRWKKHFEKQKDRYLGVLKSAEHSAHDVLIWLGKLKDYGNDFAVKYVSLTEKMPMQQHANPPNTCRPVFC